MTTPCLYRLVLIQLLFVHALVNGQNEGIENTSGVQLLGPNVNTPRDELAAFRYADKLFFSSELMSESTHKKKTRCFSVLRNEPAYLLPENPRENSRHMAHLAFNLKADRMYYSLFQKDRKGQFSKCEIWYHDRNYNGTWGARVRPPEPLNLHGSLSMYPTFGFDRTTGNELLFFVSDRPGGKGGLDIWVSEIKRGTGEAEDEFKAPVNLPFNTPGDEVSPFFDTQSQTLFFSSDSLKGQGGFDIFRIKKEFQYKWSDPVNLKKTVNSPSDEQCFSFHHASGLAYFSSNRPHAPSDKTMSSDFDIYQVEMKAEVHLNLLNATDQSPLPGAMWNW